MSDDVHEVYAIHYGHHASRSADNYIGGDPHDVLQPLDYFLWAIVGKARRSSSTPGSTRRSPRTASVRS